MLFNISVILMDRVNQKYEEAKTMTKGIKTTSVKSPATINPMIELLVNKINALDPNLDISHLSKGNISRNFKDISLTDVNDNLTVDQLLELVAIATNNKKQRDQLITDISVLTTNKKLLESLDSMTVDKLQDILENLKDPTLIKINRAVNRDAINYTDYQPSKILDVMLYIQGQKTDQQISEDPIDCAIGSVFIKIGNLKEQYFCEVFKTSVVLSDNAHQLGLIAKQVKALSSEVASLWCYATKYKKIATKQVNDKKKQADRELVRQNMINAIRDRK